MVVPVLTAHADPAHFSRDEMAQWNQNFGADIVNWYIDRTVKTFEEAALLFGRSLQTQLTEQKTVFDAKLAEKDATIATLTTDRDQFKAKTEFRR